MQDVRTPARPDPATPAERAVDDLVRRCRAGEMAAFTELYERHAAAVFRHLRVLLGACPEVEDALQVVFEQAWKSLHRYDGRSRFSTWLHGVAVMVALNFRRARRRKGAAMERLLVEPAASGRPDPEQQIASQQAAERLQRFLDDVPPANAGAFLLYFVEQWEIGDIARQLGMSKGAAWARIKRVRDSVLKTLDDELRRGPAARIRR